MPPLNTVKQTNAQFAPPARPVLVVTGGTSGIGAGTIRAFAEHTKGNIRIIVIARSQNLATELFASLPSHPNSLYEFVHADLLLVRNAANTTRALVTNEGGILREPLTKVNYLMLTHGAWLLGHPGTEEGLRPLMALGLYTRVRIARDLAPLLEQASATGEDARVMTVGYAGVGGAVDLSDLPLEKTPLSKYRDAYMTYQDIFTLRYTAEHPTVSCTHIWPGFVDSRLGDTLPWYLYYPYRLMVKLLATTPEDCGQWMMAALVDPSAKTGAHFKTDKNDAVKASDWAIKPDVSAAIWGHLVEVGDRLGRSRP